MPALTWTLDWNYRAFIKLIHHHFFHCDYWTALQSLSTKPTIQGMKSISNGFDLIVGYFMCSHTITIKTACL